MRPAPRTAGEVAGARDDGGGIVHVFVHELAGASREAAVRAPDAPVPLAG